MTLRLGQRPRSGQAPLGPSTRPTASLRTGFYIHIPYCKQRCPYCDFNIVVPSRDGPPWPGFVEAVGNELQTRAPIFAGRSADSLYFGGGTPSLAPPSVIAELYARVDAVFPLKADAEVTLEVDPGTADRAKLEGFRRAGVNRISLGWQSTDDGLLKLLGRGHDAADSRAAFVAAREAGFDNISIDLIFSVPGQSLQQLDRCLKDVVECAPNHVSLYALTYHRGTELYAWKHSGRVTPISEELEVAMMHRIDATLSAAGFHHYEVSNFAVEGFAAVHNRLYWTGGEYLGLGPGAHSFCHRQWEQGWRWESWRDPTKYAEHFAEVGAQTGMPPENDVEWIESLTGRQMVAERMLCGLRLSEGIDRAELPMSAYASDIESGVAEGMRRGWLVENGTRVAATEVGMRFADSLAQLFF